MTLRGQSCKLTEHQRALLFEADVIEAQSQDVKTLGKGRREALARCARRLRALAGGEYPYLRVSYGCGLRAAPELLGVSEATHVSQPRVDSTGDNRAASQSIVHDGGGR